MTNIIKQGDTWPYLEFAFVDDNDLPMNCNEYNVKFIVRNWKKEIIIDTFIEDSLIEGAAGAIWTSKALGTGEYRWAVADTLKQGKFEYEFKFTRLSDGRVFTLPQSEFLEYEIKADVPWDSTYY